MLVFGRETPRWAWRGTSDPKQKRRVDYPGVVGKTFPEEGSQSQRLQGLGALGGSFKEGKGLL